MNRSKWMTICTGLAFAVLMGGCGKHPHLEKGYRNPSLDEAPRWVFVPEYDDMVAEVGSAPPSPGGFQFQRTEALGNARDELARKLHTEMESVLKHRAEQRDGGKRRKMQKVVASLSDHTVRLNLSGSVQKDMWIARDGTMFVLVAIDKEHVAEALRETEIFDKEEMQTIWMNLDRALDARRENQNPAPVPVR